MRNKLILFLVLALFGSSAFLRADDVTYTFDDGTMQGWTSIDSDGDGYGWELGSAPVSYFVPGTSLAGTGHNSSADMVVSGSYSNVVGVLTPDNYLVSPKGSYPAISFWACGQDANYVAEHFGVAVSTTTATPTAFTMLQEWTMTAKGSGVKSIGRNGDAKAQGTWHQYTVDLSAYEGQEIWVAIRHFNCSDMFVLDVDDIVFGEGGEPTPPTPPTPIGDELTVYDGTATSNYVPMYVYYFDDFTRSQYIIPAADLASISGKTINALKYYTTSTNVPYTTLSTVEFIMTEVDYTNISEYVAVSDAQVVYTGTVQFTAGQEATITFDTPYQYNGGNLLIGCENLTDAGYKNISFYGQTVTGASIAGYNATSAASAPANQQNFIPKTTIVTEGGDTPPTPPTPPTPTGEFEITPSDEFALGDRPLNGWMQPYVVKFSNGAETTTVSASMSNTSGQNPFIIEEINGLVIETGDTYEFVVDVNPEAAADTYNEEFTMFYTIGGRDITTIPVSGTLYTAETPDIVELAGEVTWTSDAYTNTPAADKLHANYMLFGMEEMAKDAVYEFTLDDDYAISATGGDNFIAIYNKVENFQPTADVEPVMMGAQGVINNQILLAGDYYLVIASENIGTVTMSRSEFDAPTELTYVDPSPADGALNVNAPVTLAWEGGDNATQYQVLFGTMYPPQQAVIDWTLIDENYGSYTIEELAANTQYFWQINVKNSKGIINGEVWGFTSTMIPPNSVTANPYEIFTDESTLIKWKFNTGSVGELPETQIGSGTETSNYLPTYNLYNYSLTEQIYTAEEIGGQGIINSISFYPVGSITRNLDVYMVNTEKTSFASGTDWIAVTPEDLVFSGNVAMVPNTWVTLTLTEPFSFDGTNLAIVVNDLTGTWTSSIYYNVFSAPSQAIRVYQDSAPYNPMSPSGYDGTTMNVKNQIIINKEESKSVAENRTFRGFNVYYGDVKANDELITEKQYLLSNLPYNMEGHDINVTAVYDEGESIHSTPEVLVYVSGYGNFTGTVTEMITGAPIAGVNVKFNGKDEFNNTVAFEGTTDDNGVYTIENAKAGQYLGTATLAGMESAFVEGVTLAYNTTETVDFVMHEVYVPVGTVIAEEINASLARARWTMDAVPGGGGGSGASFTEGFENGMPQGWSIIDANNDGTTWTMTSDIPTAWSYYAGMTLDWFRTGTNAICSGSYVNGIGALNPDEYLVTPQMDLGNGSTFKFWAAATDASYAADHFGVFVSDNGTSDWTMVQEWTLTGKKSSNGGRASRDGNGGKLGNWYEFSVDLSAYAGQKYIAIRHFNCYDEYIMCVDDIELTNGSKDRAVDNYTVYRKAVLKQDAITEADSVCFNYEGEVYTPITDTLYNDADWANLEPGLYQYGVSAIYPSLPEGKGNRAEIVYDFENGEIPSDFTNTSNYPWTVVDGNGGKAMKSSNAGVPSSTSQIALSFSYPTDGTFSFDAECMGEGSSTFWDKCTFTMDGQEMFQAGANIPGWHNYSYPVLAGDHTFVWSYSKDSSVNPTGDYFMVDNVTISYEGAGEGNDDPVTPIVWSNILPKDMNTVVTVNALVSGGSPEGVNVLFVNSFDGSTVTAEMDETGTITFDEFSKGEYTLSVTLPDFVTDYNQTPVSIWDEEVVIDAHLTEVFYPVNELVVSGTGYARWTNMLPEPERVAQRYHVTLEDVFQGETTNNYMQLNVDNLVPGQQYTAAVAVIYTTGMSTFKTATFTYLGCEATSTQVEDLEGHSVCNSVLLTWNGGSGPGPGPNPGPGGSEIFDFEDSTMQGWTSIDNDGDGYAWEMGSAPVSYLVPGASLAGTGHNSSTDMVISGSYSNNYGALTPDNYLVSPSKGAYSSVSFWACGQDASYVAEHFGVAVSTGNSVSDFAMVQEWTMTAKGSGVQSIGRGGDTKAQGSWHEYTVDLSAYAGQEIWVAIRHFNCTDMFILNVDDITLTGEGGNPNPGPGPTPPPTGNEFNFDDGTMQGWTSIDNDGDGYAWEMGSAPVSYLVPGASLAGTGHNSSADMVISGSYSNNYGALTPDNYLVSPTKAAYTGISFWACGQDASYVAEHFGVAVSTGNSVNDFAMVQEWTMTAKDSGVQSIGRGGDTKAQGSWHEYTVDLSAYAGQEIWVAIRHFNCTDMFILNVDDITLGTPNKSINDFAAAGHGVGEINYNTNRDWYYYDNGTNYDAIGLTAGGGFWWGIMFPAGSYEGNAVSKISYFDNEPSSGQVTVLQGGTSAPGTLLYSQNYTTSGISDVIEIEMDEPVQIDATQNLWIVMHNTSGQYVASVDSDYPGQTNGSWLSTDNSTWYTSLYEATGGQLAGNWNLRVYIESGPSGTTTTSVIPGKYNIFMDGEVIGATSDTYFEYEVEDNAEHLYEVYYVDANYNFSCAVDGVIVAAGELESVTNLDYTMEDPEVTLTWNGIGEHYVIWRGIVEGNSVNLEPVGETTDLTYVDELPAQAGYVLYIVQTVYGDCETDLQTEIDNQNYILIAYDDVNESAIVNAIYPNPTSGDLHINANGMTRISVVNALGQMVYNAEVDADEVVLDMGQFNAGIYMVNINTVNGNVVKRVVVTK